MNGSNEAQLIERSRTGDTDAFGDLVSRYQSLICAVTFSRCGDFQRSQELAQETFVAAWQNLRSLQEPSKFKSWLCGIARNLSLGAVRKAAKEPAEGAAEIDLEGPMETATGESEPDALCMAAEEGAVVWRALEGLPENYREPMVLYYREEQSVARVAEALDLSADAVKQRLARGRGLLKSRMATVVESALLATRPGPAFTVAVVTALPVLAPSTASAAILATTAKGTVGTKAALGVSWWGPFLGGAVGVLGAWIGWKSSMKQCQSEAERQELKRMALWGLGVMALFGALIVAMVWKWGNEMPVLPLLGVILTYVIALLGLIAYWVPRMNRVRREHAPVPERDAVPLCSPGPRSYCSRLCFLGLPLVHCATGGLDEKGRFLRARAKGWFAIGDVAVSPFFAAGTVAVAPFAFGAIAVGGVAFGGLAMGVLAFAGVGLGLMSAGGAVFGWWSFGGVAVGWEAAMGGVAWARDWAMGGTGLATAANNAEAEAWFRGNAFFATSEWVAQHLSWALIVGPLGMGLGLRKLSEHLLRSGEDNDKAVAAPSMMRHGWIIECPQCGEVKPLARAGGVRIGAASYHKRTLGFCRRCRRFRWVMIRHLRPDADTPERAEKERT